MKLPPCLEAIPRLDLGLTPTPLHPLRRLETELGHSGIFLKRDDLNGLGPGGNKVRSLEYLLANAMGQNCDTVFASGPLQSNLCALTAAACAKLGLSCILVLNGERPTHFEGNLLLNELFGAQLHFLGDVSQHQREAAVVELCRQAQQEGRRPYIIENGASTGRGALGYVRAVFELLEQCKALGQDGLTLYAPAGNGGVAAGLALGNWLAGMPFHLVAVSVEYDLVQTRAQIFRILSDSAALLGVALPPNLDALCRMTDEFRGAGWGANTPESARAVFHLARLEGILIENVYISKVLVGMEAELRRGLVGGNVCLLHTGGMGSLYTQYA